MDILDAVRQFIQKDIKNRSSQLENSKEYPEEVVDTMKRLGFFALNVPEEYGGLNVSVADYAAVMEELSYGWSSLPSFLNSHNAATSILKKYGTDQQKSKYLPRLSTGELRGAISMTESSAGTDLQSITSKAEQLPTGNYRLNGRKIFVTNGARATLYVVLFKTRSEDGTYDKFNLFLVERDSRGFAIGEIYHKLAFKHVDTAELLFDNVELPAEAILGGEEGLGLSQMLDTLETGRIAIAAAAVGTARAALDAALRYAQVRETFGTTISNHQSVQIHLAEMATKVAAARALTREAAAYKDSGTRADMIAGMAKLFASEVVLEVAMRGVRIHGGYGYITEFEAERYYREAAYYPLIEGSNEIQKIIISRRLVAGDAEKIDLIY